MSKEPDKDPVDPTDAKRSRRRKQRSGLRVPSDDVPRQHLHAAAPATPAPDADADDLDDASGPYSVEPAPEDERADGADGDHAHQHAGDHAGTGAGGPAGAMAGPGPIGAHTTELPTDHFPALRPAAVDAVPVYQEDRPPVLARAITSELLAVPAEETTGSAAEGDSAPPEPARFDSYGPKTVKMTALPFEDVAGTPVAQEDEEDSVDIPIEEDEPVASEPVQRRPRASTMALSDDDLEELLDPADVADAADDADDALAALAAMMSTAKRSFSVMTPAARAEQPAADQAPAGDDESAEGRALAAARAALAGPETPDEAPAEEADAAEPTAEPGDAADAVAVAEDAPEPAQGEAPVDPADASDSGEILEDDMIEELDEPKDAAQKEALAPPAPPPAPPKTAAPGKPAPRTPPPAPKSPDAATGKARSRKGKSWFEEIFDEDYLRTLPFLTPQATQAEALFVAEALGVEPGTRLLDVGCGYGRHAMELAARGYQIVALDLSLPLLLRGADEAQRRGLSINFIHGDMRDLVFESQFDGVYCLFSTFGYFDEDTNRATIEGMARALKQGGRLVLDVLNRDYLIGELPTRVWWEGDGCVVLEEVEFNYFTSRIHSNRSIVFDDGRQLEQEISIRSYSLHELGKMLQSAGLRVVEVSGSTAMRGRFFGNQSRGLIVVAEKRERARTASALAGEPPEPTVEDDIPDVDVTDV